MGGEKLKTFRIFLIIVSIFTGGMVFAQSSDPAPTADETQSVSEGLSASQAAEQAIPIEEEGVLAPEQGPASVFMILRMVLVLALVAAAIYGVVFFLKRLSRPPQQRDPHLRILAGAHLGSNRFVHVVSVGSRAWLVGDGENGVSLIAELEEQELIHAMLLEDSRKSAEARPSRDFSRILARFGWGGKKEQPVSGGDNLHAENLRKRRERLKDL